MDVWLYEDITILHLIVSFNLIQAFCVFFFVSGDRYVCKKHVFYEKKKKKKKK